MVPETDGLTVCREIRRVGSIAPILMLTARGEIRERVLGLEAGADDYMVKPFEVDEFVARIRAQLRRTSCFSALRVGDLELDRVTQWLQPAARSATKSGAWDFMANRERDAISSGLVTVGAERGVERSCQLTRAEIQRERPRRRTVG